MGSGNDLIDLAERLRRRSRKLTGPRQVILAALRESRKPLSCQELFAALPRRQCNLVTVYRAMRVLEEAKLVTRVDLGDGVAHFTFTGHDGHHHHLICTRCSEVVELRECFPGDWEQELTRRHGFKGVTHRLEFYGLCPACQ